MLKQISWLNIKLIKKDVIISFMFNVQLPQGWKVTKTRQFTFNN